MIDFLVSYFSEAAFVVVSALALDRMIGEPKNWHPLIWFGKWVDACRARFQLPLDNSVFHQRFMGVVAWGCAVIPWILIYVFIMDSLPHWLHILLSIVVLYFCIGWQSLREHAEAILVPLEQGDIANAREAVGRIVSRDTNALDESGIAKAGIESVLENGADAIFAPIFWYFLLGPVGALLYRLSNTLDAMWGYKNRAFIQFGWCAARFDDVMNYLPARLVVITYAICGEWEPATRCARQQSYTWKSPNAGPVMSAGAGALGVEVGGEAPYFGKLEQRPVLGEGLPPTPHHLSESIKLIDKGVYLWGVVICILI
ncbi:cobalamin biosynthesis protein [Marinomonas mediterranea]|jgi:adenosylcobinamide-phosphate synthase (EC 6.3.1.10)|uniref:Cobalamin biosynthesis protein CobD n=1 Tax=Marinomonas mediterranea (strain ATCC 700492 / JCM 21426 / NBRC 103028 / MMB-1) TaxID=717774 RepID=F2JTQ1_MARM1|nr:adenosylcobinamide-phosphate synthase CbiB [Marinomonas mediterranea]ADZ92671.1 cobalamin biosynthesis protein CobD [Marinomonas mediterranea MMB-1]WCN14658.1 cobalamin biosynthesis protein [Marinomonas mediterranea]WCN18703.1 cobalamin biosynthesis protein [Marinomonas mediterranea MMB-1]